MNAQDNPTRGKHLERQVTGDDGRNQYWVDAAALDDAPMIVDGFQIDNDVIVLHGLGLSRADLRIEQQDADTVISVPGRVAGHDKERLRVAVLRGLSAADLDPMPVVEQLCAALNANSIAAAVTLLADDVVWEMPGPMDILPWAGVCHGPAAVENHLQGRAAGIEIERFAIQSAIVQGNTVAVILHEQGRSKATGMTFAGGVVLWVMVEGGQIKLVQFYQDTYPIVEALMGGRPFTVQPHEDAQYYVVKPLPSPMTTDNFIFDAAELETPPLAVQTVQRMYAALQSLNVDKLQEVFAPDVLWDIFGPPDLLVWAGPRNGPEGAAESARQILDTMHFDHFKPTRMIYQGNTVAVTIDEGGTSTATGVPFKTSVVHVVTTNAEGQVVLFRNYINTTEIVEAFLGGRPFTVS